MTLNPKFFSILPAVAFVALSFSGCQSLDFMGARLPIQTFFLDPGQPNRARNPISASASVHFVDVASPFGSGNFQYRLTESDWESDPLNRFLTSPQEMFTRVLRTWLQEASQFSAITLPGTGSHGEFRVFCDVTELFIDFRHPDAPEAVVTMEIKITRVGSAVGEPLIVRKFSAREPVSARTPDAFVVAWNAALRRNLSDLSAAIP